MNNPNSIWAWLASFKQPVAAVQEAGHIAVPRINTISHDPNIGRTADQNFEIAFDRLIGHEGEYSDNYSDNGNWTGGRVGKGELKGTKYGIAANTYPDLDIKGLTLEDAKRIYRRDWWDKIKGDQMHFAIVYQLWDFAINSGMPRAVKELQKALGLKDDGIIGPVTLKKVNETYLSDVLLLLNARRILFLTGLSAKDWNAFGRGWMRRVASNLEYAARDN